MSKAIHPNYLDQYFDEAATGYPEAIAIEQGETIYNYAKVEQLANRLAHYLRIIGIAPEEKVAILLHRCAQVPIVMLGVLKAGGAYIPLDSEIPADRVNFIMQDSGAKLLITSDTILERITS